MFSYRQNQIDNRGRGGIFSINGNTFSIPKLKIAQAASPIIASKLQELKIDIDSKPKRNQSKEDENPIFDFQIKEINPEQNSELIESIKLLTDLFDFKSIKFNHQNNHVLLIIARFFKMDSLAESIEEYEKFLKNIESDIINCNELAVLINFEEQLMNLSEENFDKTAEECYKLNQQMSHQLFVYTIIRILSLDYEKSFLFMNLIKKVDELNGENCFENENSIFNLFFSFIQNQKVIKPKEFDIQKLLSYKQKFIQNQTIEQTGEESDSIIEALKKDDINTFQTILSNSKIDINQQIDEKFVKKEINLPLKFSITFIKYSAFKGSVKCFKYLLLNEAKIDQETLALFAICSGNTEIIHLCEQNQCSFDGTVKVSIKNHLYEITQWLLENKKDKSCIGSEFYVKSPLKYCLRFCNFKSLKDVISITNDISDLLISSAKFNNELLTHLSINILQKYKCNCIYLSDDRYCPISSNLFFIYQLYISQLLVKTSKMLK